MALGPGRAQVRPEGPQGAFFFVSEGHRGHNQGFAGRTSFLHELPELRRARQGFQRTLYGLRRCDEHRRVARRVDERRRFHRGDCCRIAPFRIRGSRCAS